MSRSIGLRAIAPRSSRLLVLALSAMLTLVLAVAVVGGRSASRSIRVPRHVAAPGVTVPAGAATDEPAVSAAPVGVGGGTSRPSSAPAAGGAVGAATPRLPQAASATRDGIGPDYIEWGMHAPLTVNGAPVSTAERPLTGFKGYVTYLNRQGGVNGRKIRLRIADDRGTTDGAAVARDQLVRQEKPFFISGWIGPDQIAIVAKAAAEARIPYMAPSGPEPEWRALGVIQISASGDQVAARLAELVCAQGSAWLREPVRMGISTVDSIWTRPIEGRFVAALGKCGIAVDQRARVYVQPQTQQPSYTPQALELKAAYSGRGPNLMVPIQDPLTTAREIAEWKGQNFRPRWTFMTVFVHDQDMLLTLMAKEWTGARGVTLACYYQWERAFDPALCGQMRKAHDEWVALGQVTFDEDNGGSAGGKSSYTYDQASWDADANGGVNGYQHVHFWLGAMRSVGADPTREKFLSALLAYDGYSDLITSPITFKGSGNTMRGADRVSVWEGQSNDKWKQISIGLVDHF